MSGDEAPAKDQFPELTAFEAALAALAPRAAALDRDALFFQAGQAAALRDLGHRRSPWTHWGWPAAFSVMTAVAATLLVMVCLRGEQGGNHPAAGPTSEIATSPPAPLVLPDHGPQQEDQPAGAGTYLRLREEILRQGFKAYPPEKVASTEATAVATGPLTYRELLDQILQE